MNSAYSSLFGKAFYCGVPPPDEEVPEAVPVTEEVPDDPVVLPVG